MISKGSLVQYTPTLDGTEGIGPILLTISEPYVRHPHRHGTNVQVVDILDEVGCRRIYPLTALVKVQ